MQFRLISSLLQAAAQLRPWPRLRDLRREQIDQATEKYWRRRERSSSWRFRVLKLRYGFWSFITSRRSGAGLILGTVASLVRPVASGVLILAMVLVIEQVLFHHARLGLLPTGEPGPPLGAFPALAVQVLAAFLGFYLATIGIVLSNAYHDVSAVVRALILKSTQTSLYLKSLGMSIGAGFVLVLLQSVDLVSFGYLTIGVYALLLCFSGWAFVKLAFGAFDLMNPLLIGNQPMDALYRAINRLDAKGLLQDDAVLRAVATEADRALQILTELAHLTKSRRSVDRRSLARMVDLFLLVILSYARKKHNLAPTSGWFIREPVYPRWVETTHPVTLIALQTSTPLQARMDPVPDWLERRAAELVAIAIEACVITNDLDATLQITRSAASTARNLAANYRIDDAIAFAEIIRDRCWSISIKHRSSQRGCRPISIALIDRIAARLAGCRRLRGLTEISRVVN